ncbi:unnamed protein product [Amoebophrya sp. A120]|nr:unnamed protein product [Amoebophrya sp. A120]|eukprot:GSA120T00006564001.1
MNHLLHTVRDYSTLKPGDHVYVWGPLALHQHHGIVTEILEAGSFQDEEDEAFQAELCDRILVTHFFPLDHAKEQVSEDNHVGEVDHESATSASSIPVESRTPTPDATPSGPTSAPTASASLPELGRKLFMDASFAILSGKRRDALASVHQVTLRDFCNGRVLKKAKYAAQPWELLVKRSGTCYAEAADTDEETLVRAACLRQARQERPYDFNTLLHANCEHMAFWCKTGIWRSSQTAFFVWVEQLVIQATRSGSRSTSVVGRNSEGQQGRAEANTNETQPQENPSVPAVSVHNAHSGQGSAPSEDETAVPSTEREDETATTDAGNDSSAVEIPLSARKINISEQEGPMSGPAHTTQSVSSQGDNLIASHTFVPAGDNSSRAAENGVTVPNGSHYTRAVVEATAQAEGLPNMDVLANAQQSDLLDEIALDDEEYVLVRDEE